MKTQHIGSTVIVSVSLVLVGCLADARGETVVSTQDEIKLSCESGVLEVRSLTCGYGVRSSESRHSGAFEIICTCDLVRVRGGAATCAPGRSPQVIDDPDQTVSDEEGNYRLPDCPEEITVSTRLVPEPYPRVVDNDPCASYCSGLLVAPGLHEITHKYACCMPATELEAALPAHSLWVCRSNADCPDDEYCAGPPGTCGGPGVCEMKPTECIVLWDPVCGCDGVTHANRCTSAMAGTRIAFEGQCRDPLDFVIPE